MSVEDKESLIILLDERELTRSTITRCHKPRVDAAIGEEVAIKRGKEGARARDTQGVGEVQYDSFISIR